MLFLTVSLREVAEDMNKRTIYYTKTKKKEGRTTPKKKVRTAFGKTFCTKFECTFFSRPRITGGETEKREQQKHRTEPHEPGLSSS